MRTLIGRLPAHAVAFIAALMGCDDSRQAQPAGGAGSATTGGTSAPPSTGGGSGGTRAVSPGAGGTRGEGGQPPRPTGGSQAVSNGGSGGSGQGGRTSDGGRPQDAGGSTGSGMMPWDSAIYGPMPEGAVYIFTEQYVTVEGGRVTRVQNAADPGNRDMIFNADPKAPAGWETRPTWHESGGLNGQSYASFNNKMGERGIATGFAFDPDAGTNEIALQVVGRYREVQNILGYGAIVTSPDNFSWMATFAVRSDDPNDLWRTNGDITNPPHNIDYLTPEASNDTSWQLHEGYSLQSGLLAFRNGVQYGPGGTGGPRPGHGVLNEVNLGGGFPSGDGGFAPIDVHELVVTEGRPLEQLEAYRNLRVAPLYGLSLE